MGRAGKEGREGEAEVGQTRVSTFEICVLTGLGVIAFALVAVADAIGRANRHLSNVADRLLDIESTLRGRR